MPPPVPPEYAAPGITVSRTDSTVHLKLGCIGQSCRPWDRFINPIEHDLNRLIYLMYIFNVL